MIYSHHQINNNAANKAAHIFRKHKQGDKAMKNNITKKIAAMLLIGALSTASVTAAVSANDGTGIEQMDVTVTSLDQTMYVNNSAGANIRTAPGTDYRVLKKLSNGTAVHVTGKTSNGWYQTYTTDPVYGGETAGYISGGLLTSSGSTSTKTYTVHGVDCYLALRTARCYDDSNIIGKLYEGETVQVSSDQYNSGNTYWWVTAPSLGKSGYVNSEYLRSGGSSSSIKTVSVRSFLSLRTGPSTNYTELGRLTNGSTVLVTGSMSNGFYPVTVISAASGSTGTLTTGYVYAGYLC